MNAIAWIMVGFVLTVVIVACIVDHEARKERRSLGRYRPTHDNRYPHRDELGVVNRAMRDWK